MSKNRDFGNSQEIQSSKEIKNFREFVLNKWTALFTAMTALTGYSVSSPEKKVFIESKNLSDNPELLKNVDMSLNVIGEAFLDKKNRETFSKTNQERLELEEIFKIIQREHGWYGQAGSEEEIIDFSLIKENTNRVEELAVDQALKETYQKIFDVLPNKNFNLTPKNYGVEEFLISDTKNNFKAELVVEHEEGDTGYDVSSKESYTLSVDFEGQKEYFNVDSLPEFSKMLSHIYDLFCLWTQYKDGLITKEQYELNKENMKNR